MFYAFICIVNTARKWAIIVAAGRGNRFGSELPKQFVLLNSKPVILHSMQVFAALDYQIVVVIHPDDQSYFAELSEKHQFPHHQIVFGGEERFHSVQNALELVPNIAEVVLIHDAARPNIDSAFIQRLETELDAKDNAIPALPVSDSLRMWQDERWSAVHRDDYRIIQTPQFFRATALKKAYQQDYTKAFTDDASVLESDGGLIHLVEGKNGNIKITIAQDMQWMSFLMSNNEDHEN
jgi:2-C-methyl-D-erythritol 4-phosphate cytidylyltransferase